MTPLYYAIKNDHVKVIKCFFSQNSDVESKNALFLFVEMG